MSKEMEDITKKIIITKKMREWFTKRVTKQKTQNKMVYVDEKTRRREMVKKERWG